MMEDVTPTALPSKDHVPICAIGASAGGVGALRNLFQQLPDDLGLAYVVILHLSPEHPSAMAEILSSCTKMPVHQVDDAPEIKPNCVYVIPPDRELVIEGDSVHAREFSEPRGLRAPIDMFFRSVAAARGDGMAVVLTGAGSDGSSGVRTIQEAGGVVFAQDPAEAEFPSMPQSAIATGVVSFISPISRLAEQIVEVSRSKQAVRSLDEGDVANDLRRIIGFLRARTGHDFGSYKRATVMRRVLRRMQVCRTRSMSVYGDLIQSTPEEAQELFNDLLISVTLFFRDEPSFDALATKVIGPIFEDVGPEGLRVWSAGCATGEEAYSLAILMLEEAERRQTRVPIQIFASDLDEGALGTAREARYPRSIEADVSKERLARFFIDEGSHYRVREEVREIVLFASHSVLKDPPFLRLDLIVCRNLLIYLERTLQEQLLDLFSYGLRPDGYLFLGSAETADARSDLFSSVDRDARLYRVRLRPNKNMPTLPHVPRQFGSPSADRHQGFLRDRQQAPALRHEVALERSAPPSVLVDETQQIVHMSRGAGRFILHSGGTFSGKLSDVVRPELRLDLKIALDKALEKKRPTLTLASQVAFDGGPRRISMQVSPVPGDGNSHEQALVVFLDAGPSEVGQEPDEETAASGTHDMRRLYTELKVAQEALVASRREHETSIEDLRAANEELQSINEEYRSTSEELETSKEELQSMNEELQTVNAELKSKLKSTSSAHSDLRNLIAATEVGTLFLDTDLRIRMFTPPIADLFNVGEMDIGRAVTDFTNRLDYSLEDDARRVLHDLVPFETEIESGDGRWFIIRLRPYRSIEEKIEGVVLTFVDITSRRLMERELFLSQQQRYQILFDSIDEGFAIIEMIYREGRPVDYRFLEVNDAFDRQTGLSDVVGKSILEMVPDAEDYWMDLHGRVAATGQAERFEAPARGLGRHFDVYAFPVGNPSKHQVAILFRDVTERKKAEAQRKMLTAELSHRVKNTLAVVQALARQPAVSSLTLEQYRDRFIGRIQALGRAHDQLLDTNWQSADLKMLTKETLSAYGENGPRHLEIEGPQVLLTPKQGLGLALVLHELATNASKYGSLSIETGTLSVTWDIEHVEHGRQVQLNWRESDGPLTESDATEGFGTKLIRQACSYELNGSVELRRGPEGFTAEIMFPI